MEKYLKQDFYQKNTLSVARNLIGKLFIRKINNEILTGIIVETEAYHQNNDASCHASRGQTKRNQVMFQKGGHLYVYFTYGMHYCMNVVTETEEVGSAVLIRAIEPISGIKTMQKNRNFPNKIFNITNGPAKCCQALCISTNENGTFLNPSNHIWIENYVVVENSSIVTTKRIGISKSKELLWRFYWKNSCYFSKK